MHKNKSGNNSLKPIETKKNELEEKLKEDKTTEALAKAIKSILKKDD